MKTVKTFLSLMALLFLMTACSAAPSMRPVAVHTPVASDQIPIAAGDRVHLTVYEEQQMTGDYVVDDSGFITVPLIGAVQADGQTKRDVQEAISSSLRSKKLYSDPHVTVDVGTTRPFYILGEVNKPGSYAYIPSLDVFSAIAMAGGYTPRASQSGIIVSRVIKGQKIRFYATEDSPIFPGDSITVQQRFF
jgi:polysaccharide export outer membrane protein